LESYIAGWGLTKQNPNVRPYNLKVIKVKVIDWNICKRERPIKFQDWHVCAGLPIKYKSSCKVNIFLNQRIKIKPAGLNS